MNIIKISIFLVFASLSSFTLKAGIAGNTNSFIENLGQLSSELNELSEAKFYCQLPGVDIYIFPNEIMYVFTQFEYASNDKEYTIYPKESSNDLIKRQNINDQIDLFKNKPLKYRSEKISLKFLNSNEISQISPSNIDKYKLNYYNEENPDGIIDVSSYKSITINNLYDGIDLVISSNERFNSIKYDLIVKAGADANKIKMHYVGASECHINNNGDLNIKANFGELIEESPFVYQNNFKDGSHTQSTIKSRYKQLGKNIIGFDLGNYDKSKDLIIDPNVIWSKLYGGLGADHAYDIAIDSDDYFYLTGHTLSGNLPVTNGVFQEIKSSKVDLYVAKFDPFSELVWATFYGSTEEDYCRAIAVSRDFDIYVTGHTFSPNFPISIGSFSDVFNGGVLDGFLIKFRNNGVREWATFVGGNNSEQFDDIAIDKNQNPVIVGHTQSSNFPIDAINGFQKTKLGKEDAVIVNFNKDGQFNWGTFFGGDSTDIGRAVAIDSIGNIIVTGETGSINIPIGLFAYQENNHGFLDIFLLKFDEFGNYIWSTYLGGEKNDMAYSLVTDRINNIYFCGQTFSNNFPTTPNVIKRQRLGVNDGFVSKFNPLGQMTWSTLFGGASRDECLALTVDKESNIVFIGQTYSNNIPFKPVSLKDTITGKSDAFLIKMLNDATGILWGGYFGGSNDDVGYGVVTDDSLNVILCGDTESPDFPIFNDPDNFIYSQFIDGFVTKICKTQLEPRITSDGDLYICSGESIKLDAGANYKTYKWNTGDTTRTINVAKAGIYYVSVADGGHCFADSPPIEIFEYPTTKIKIQGKTLYCLNDSTQLFIQNEYKSYKWSTGQTTKSIFVKKEGQYTVEIVDMNGCKAYDTVVVKSHPIPSANKMGPTNVCQFTKDHEYIAISRQGHSYSWVVLGGFITDGQGTPRIKVDWGPDGIGKVELAVFIDSVGCNSQEEPLIVNISKDLEPEITSLNSDNFYFCSGDSLILDAGEYRNASWNTGYSGRFLIVKSPGIYHVIVYDGTNCWGYDTVEVFEVPVPQPIVSGNQNVCVGQIDSEYETNLNQLSTYEWEIADGNIKSGQGTNKIMVDWLVPGTYTIKVTEKFETSGCVGTSTDFSVIVHSLPEPIILYDRKLEFCQGDSVRLFLDKNYHEVNWNTGESTDTITVKSSGNYFVNVTDEFGCSFIKSIDVIVYPLPDEPTIIESNDTLYTIEGYLYQWFLDGNLLQNSSDYFHEVKNAGEYTVLVTNEFGCSRLSKPFIAYIGNSTIHIQMPDSLATKTNKIVKVPIKIDNYQNLDLARADEFELYFIFNSSLLYPINYNPIEKSDNFSRIKVIGKLSQLNDSILAILEFTSAWGDSKCTLIQLDSVAFPGSNNLNVTNDEGTIYCLTDLCEAGEITRLFIRSNKFELTQNFPNPFSEYTEFEFTAIEKGNTKLIIQDSQGNELYEVMNEYIEPGKYHIVLNNLELANGIYFYVLQTPTRIESKKMQIIK